MAYTDEDVWALNVFREAQGEGVEGMRCVAWVTDNIARARNLTIEATVMLRNEFSWTAHVGLKADGTYDFVFPSDDNPYWKQCEQVVADIVDGKDKDDPTDGALYYANLDTVIAANRRAGLPENAGWFMRHIVGDPINHPETIKVLHHTFYK